MSIISYSDDPDEQLETLNSLILKCIERDAPLKRIRVTRPAAPWMKCPTIKDLKKERDTLRYEAHNTRSDTKWDYFRSVRKKLKAAIRTARKAFIEKALYSNKSSEVSSHRILQSSPKPLRFNPDELNGHFAFTAQRTLDVNTTPYVELTELIENLPDDSDDHTRFHISPVIREEVFTAIKHLLDKKTLLLPINSFVFNKLFCCSWVRGNTSKRNLHKLQNLAVLGLRKSQHIS